MIPQDTHWPQNPEEDEENIEEIVNLADPLIYARSTKLAGDIKMQHTVLDSKATHNMNSNREHFETIHPLVDRYGRTAFAILGDGTTKCEIKGHGYAQYNIDGKPVQRHELYVPNLNGHLTSVLQHSKFQGCYFHCENQSALLAFPTATMSANCDDEITMPISMQKPDDVLIFNEEHAKKCDKYTKNKTLSVYSAKATEWLDEADVSPLTETVKIRKIRDGAMYPTQASEGAAGYDVSPSKYIIQPNEIVKIPLGIAISPPSGMYTRIADRSSLASQGLVTRGGVID
jgi:hypothetical protein